MSIAPLLINSPAVSLLDIFTDGAAANISYHWPNHHKKAKAKTGDFVRAEMLNSGSGLKAKNASMIRRVHGPAGALCSIAFARPYVYAGRAKRKKRAIVTETQKSAKTACSPEAIIRPQSFDPVHWLESSSIPPVNRVSTILC